MKCDILCVGIDVVITEGSGFKGHRSWDLTAALQLRQHSSCWSSNTASLPSRYHRLEHGKRIENMIKIENREKQFRRK